MADKFLIAPFDSGLRDDLPSWLIPEKAFTRLNNAYVFRGRVKKRFGSVLIGTNLNDAKYDHLYSRLRIALSGGAGVGTTDGGGDAAGTIPGDTTSWAKLGITFSIDIDGTDTAIYTVKEAGVARDMLQTYATTTATYSTTNGQYSFTGAPADKQIYVYLNLPVMGFFNYESGPVNEHSTFAFDTRAVYKYDGTSWERNGTTTWKGTQTDYFWAENHENPVDASINSFATNYNVTKSGAPAATDDPIYYYDGSTWTNFSTITKFYHDSVAGDEDYVASCRCIASFDGSLLLFNVIEHDNSANTNKHFPFRLRYSAPGNPFAADAWLEKGQEYGVNKYAGGGFIDAPTSEEITSVAFIKDRLVVYCERSTYELMATGDNELPFKFQAINDDSGSEGTFSTVIFDKHVLTVSTTGINSCDGAYVQRIDEEIPDKVFEILKTSAGTKRIYGVRDFYNEMVYWSYLKRSHATENTYNDSLMVYNYRAGTWAFNDDCINSFGYLEAEEDLTGAATKAVICGNHKGFIFVIDSDGMYWGKNAESQNIVDMSYVAVTPTSGTTTLTIPYHNLRDNDFIKVQYPQGLTSWTDGIYKVTRVDADNVEITTATWTETYTGGGNISLVSRMEIETKDLNPYIQDGSSIYLGEVNFNVDKIANGEVTVNYSTSSSVNVDMVSDATSSGAILGTSILETGAYSTIPLEAYQDKLWHKVYLQAEGRFVKLKLSLSDTQMVDENISEASFTLNGMILNIRKGGNV
jgi:hypothetical protein